VDIDLSIVIPAYNEEKRIGSTLLLLHDYFHGKPATWEIVVVDDGSEDKTVNLLKDFQTNCRNTRIVELPLNYGKGRAVKEGVLTAKGRYILIMDADLAAPCEEIPKLTDIINENFDGAVGTRTVPGRGCVATQSLIRKITSRLFNLAVRVLVLKGFSDTQCGFKIFKKEIIHEICEKQIIDGFGYDVEILYLAKKSGYKIKEVPINWTAIPGSKVRMLRDSFDMLKDILKIRGVHGKKL
jgi:dolichyl-phosphate beta-glucosyltransferase